MHQVKPKEYIDVRKPILVTGSHRSGSTWVGKILSKADRVGYVQEPFNPGHRPGICSMEVSRWFLYVTRDNEAPYIDALTQTLGFFYNASGEAKALRTPKDALRLMRDWGLFLYHRATGSRPLMKDPLAFFSAEWLADRFGADVVVLVRHPAAFASSLKRLDWQYDFSNMLEQPLLMRDYLGPFEEEMRAYVAHERDIIDQAALLWKIIYYVAACYREAHPDWLFVRHEDLSRQPLDAFRDLFSALHLDFTPASEAALRTFTSPDNPAEAPEGTVHFWKRDSKANIWTWKERLTDGEVERIRTLVDDVAVHFYHEDDW